MISYAQINIYRSHPLSIEELLKTTYCLDPHEAFVVNKLNEKLLGEKFKVEDGNDEATENVKVPVELLRESISTQEHISPALLTEGSFFEKRLEETPLELVIDAYEAREGKTLIQTMQAVLPKHSTMMSSLDVTYEYEKCEAGWQDHYFRVRLTTKFSPASKDPNKDIIISVQQIPYRLLMMCDDVEAVTMLYLAENALLAVTGGMIARDITIKTSAPTSPSTPELLRGVAQFREKYF